MRVYGLSKSNAKESQLRHDRRRSGPVVLFRHPRDVLVVGGRIADARAMYARPHVLWSPSVGSRRSWSAGSRNVGSGAGLLWERHYRAAPSLSAPTPV